MKKSILVFILSVFLSCCEKQMRNRKYIKSINDLISYPYLAEKFRSSQIANGAAQIKAGDSLAEVIAIMGRPDEMNPTIDKNDWSVKTGYSLVYVIRRDMKYGSVVDKNEQLVRVHFGFDDLVYRVDYVGN